MSRLKAGLPLIAADLAREGGVTVRTAHRDLAFLRDQLHAPIEFDRQRLSYFLTDTSFTLPLISFTQGELLALFFAEKVARQYRGTPYEADLLDGIRRITAELPEQVQVDLSTLDGFLSLDLGPLIAPDVEAFRCVVRALGERRRLRIRYTSLSQDRTADRTVDPYRVYNLRGDWYLAAFDPRHGQVRDFALHRIRSASVIDERYEIDPDFRFEDYSAGAFSIEKGTRPVTVAVRFAPRQARWIRERKWHPSARIQDRKDGGCVLKMEVTGLGEVRRWVMQFGAEAEVLQPASLRREVAAELRASLRSYATDSAGLTVSGPRTRGGRRGGPVRAREV
ncbi:MAG TPA: WYL domain-containing protein [Vicinamibacteria bacterium]|nr:WYL domain-containing protein [Vicinamibacteria bacterium]